MVPRSSGLPHRAGQSADQLADAQIVIHAECEGVTDCNLAFHAIGTDALENQLHGECAEICCLMQVNVDRDAMLDRKVKENVELALWGRGRCRRDQCRRALRSPDAGFHPAVRRFRA